MGSKILISGSKDPLLNLAKELSILQSSPSDDNVLFLWRSTPAALIGRNQNPHKECNLDYNRENDIKLARRYTGGGSIFIDPGSTCFSFFNKVLEPERNLCIIKNAIQSLGLKPKIISSRDIEIKGRLVAKSVYMKDVHRSMHHGTMYLNTDINKLMYSLNVDLSKHQLNEPNYIPLEIMNIGDVIPQISHRGACEAIVEAYKKVFGECEVIHDSAMELMKDIEARKKYEELGSKKWLFGDSSSSAPYATKKFSFGMFDITINKAAGGINGVVVNTDSLLTELYNSFSLALNNCFLNISSAPLDSFVNSVPEEQRGFAMELAQWAAKIIKKFI